MYHLHLKGKWYTGLRFSELEIAKSWGLKPSTWDSCSDEDKAEMLAYESSLGDMRSYEDHLDDEKRLRQEALQKMKR